MSAEKQQINRREHLMKHIEEERLVLNRLLSHGAKTEEIYTQSLVVDRLIEQFIVLP
ncbi:MAG: hypothetical protein ACLVEV_06165 [Lachnospiraceae bacterium]|uniref:hypothetical protein n=1 Tax=Parablautia sp. Marseille-Q6255 TaxID=3039593 RepID=UPI0024BC92B2|nr:hypothetical protein [Parablautia sp. Marseille-Q6255]